MAHARQADRAFPQSAIYFAAAALAAVVLTGIIGLVTLDPLGFGGGVDRPSRISPALREAGLQWELQRKQQYGHLDPLIQAGRDWERRYKQISGDR